MFSSSVMLREHVDDSEVAMTTTYRPQPLWLLMGPLLGAVSGSLIGALALMGLLLADPLSDPSGTEVLQVIGLSLTLGGIYGAGSGAVVGFLVAVPLVFLVGSHLPRDVARRRALALGLVLPPVMLAVCFVLYTGNHLAWPQAEERWWLLAPLGASALGGPMAARAARTAATRTTAS